MPPTPPAALLLCLVFICVSSTSAAVKTCRRLPPPGYRAKLGAAQEVHEAEIRVVLSRPNASVVMTMGDSITGFGYNPNGWARLLMQDMDPALLWVNKGVPSATSCRAWPLSMWTTTDAASPLAKTPARLKLVTVCFGANDAISTDEYMRNLQAGIDAFRAVGVNSFLLITPPPSSRMNNTEDPRAYAAACKEVGKLLGVPVVDTFSALTAVPDWQQTVLLQDGLHLAGKGQQVFHDAVLAGVTEHFPSLLRTKQE